MKKLISKLILFAVILAVVVESVNIVYVKRDKSDPNYIRKFQNIPNEIQICNFGSSHGLYSYDYEELEEKDACFNFGLSAQSLSYDYRLFQEYSDHIKEHAVVFITLSYFSFFGEPEENSEDFASKNARYYPILPAKLIKQYDFATDLFTHYVPALGAETDVLIKTLLGKTVDDGGDDWQRVAFDIDVSADAEGAYVRHIEYNQDEQTGQLLLNQESVDALYALIEGCQKQGATPILVTTPYLAEYTNAVKKNAPGFYDQFYSIVNQVVNDTGVEYYDYAFDERFSDNYAWFMNSDHLNQEGARNFVHFLIEEAVH